MKKHPKWPWRTRMQLIALFASLAIGIIFRILGDNPSGFFDLWEAQRPHIPFLWISAAAYLASAILSYTLWPLVRTEMTNKDGSISQGQPSLWYKDEKMIRAIWLVYRVIWPSLCIAGILLIVETISHLEMLTWLAGLAVLIFIVADIMALIWMLQAYSRRTKKPVQEQQTSI